MDKANPYNINQDGVTIAETEEQLGRLWAQRRDLQQELEQIEINIKQTEESLAEMRDLLNE